MGFAHDAPWMQWQPDPREETIEREEEPDACARCFEELGRADPMCPACGSAC